MSCASPRLLAAAALLVMVVASACSMVSVGYRHAPTLLSWRATEYFELEGEQRTQFRARLEAVHEWHRTEALPELLRTLDEAQLRLERPLDPADGEWLVEALLAHYRVVIGRIIDESADLLATLSPGQIAALEERLSEKALEYQQKWIDASPRRVRRARFERVLEHAEGWLGRLSPAQRAWLQTRLDEIPADYRGARADRARREAEFIALLRANAAAPGWREVTLESLGRDALHRWAVDWDEGRSPAQRAQAERLRRAYVVLGVDLINRATPEQRERVRGRLAAYVSALSEHAAP